MNFQLRNLHSCQNVSEKEMHKLKDIKRVSRECRHVYWRFIPLIFIMAKTSQAQVNRLHFNEKNVGHKQTDQRTLSIYSQIIKTFQLFKLSSSSKT